MRFFHPPLSLPRLAAALLATLATAGTGLSKTDPAPSSATFPSLAVPAPGEHTLRVLSPLLLEVGWITAPPPATEAPAPLDGLDFFKTLPPEGRGKFPSVTVAGAAVNVVATGFKRRPIYAPLLRRDLRVGNYLYLQLGAPVADDQEVTVEISDATNQKFPHPRRLSAKADPLRFNPAIHVNQAGYHPTWSKTALVGFYLGSLGEMEISRDAGFQLVNARTGEIVHRGKLVRRPDEGFPFRWYQQVFEADFGDFQVPGEYRLGVPGLGVSHPFRIDEGLAAAYARTYALGLYHQRCGTDNALPFTRFVHGACHTALADVPTPAFEVTQKFLAGITAERVNPRQTAPQLKGVEAGLYPFVRHGKIDVSGGHHDAGDYSKYTINCAALIHHLVFAADAFPGAGELDNLGLPESGDGRSDLLQEAKHEADFLFKLQDDDGGFAFLVYPLDRKYEHDVLPDRGHPQVVWPKNTAATAASVAALAQTASSPRFRREFPADAERYLQAARRGWDFLTAAIARHGRDGAYQKLTHYGDQFMHDDELAWAACELFVATGEKEFHDRVHEWLRPEDPETRRWGWWRMCEGYGQAIRAYAFAARSGRLARDRLDRQLLLRCENEIASCADDWLQAARQSAYGTSFPVATKRMLGAGWYFPTDPAFDLAVACEIDFPKFNDPRPAYRKAVLTNLDYVSGCNPVNVSYLTGFGWNQPREIVHQYAQNDRNVLPPGGIPLGVLQDGFGWMDIYGQELGAQCYPLDGAKDEPYPMYDRWGDSFNLKTEFVVVNQARALATAAWLMAQTSLRSQPWRTAAANITGPPSTLTTGRPVTVRLAVPELDPGTARIVWEARDQEPVFAHEFTFVPKAEGSHWVEAEALWPDGRRVSAGAVFTVTGGR